jgi:hypothetical protein
MILFAIENEVFSSPHIESNISFLVLFPDATTYPLSLNALEFSLDLCTKK